MSVVQENNHNFVEGWALSKTKINQPQKEFKKRKEKKGDFFLAKSVIA